MTPDEFFEWQLRQEKLYELVDGLPILPLKMKTGATQRHDRAVVNTLLALGNQLRGNPCRPTIDDLAVRIPKGNIRRPDITIECGKPGDRDMTVAEPRVVFEVLSPSTMSFDRFRKLEEYKTVPDIAVIVMLDTEAPQATVHRRSAGIWKSEMVEGLEAFIDLPEVGARLALAEIFEGIRFDAGSL